MAINTLYKVKFQENMRTLVGTQANSILADTFSKETMAGEVAFVESIGADIDATETYGTDFATLATEEENYEKFAALSSAGQTWDEYKKMLTPHEDVNRQKTQFIPRLIETGHTFPHNRKILEVMDTNSRTMQMVKRKYIHRFERLLLNALSEASVNRARLAGSTSNVNFPASQKIDMAFADYAGDFRINVLDEISQRFERNYEMGSRIYVLISPNMKKTLLDKDRDKIHSRDFVTSYEHFTSGTVPEISRCTLLCHPLLEFESDGTTLANKWYAYTGEGVVLGDFGDEISRLEEDSAIRYQARGYYANRFDAHRVDDKLVIQGSILAAE